MDESNVDKLVKAGLMKVTPMTTLKRFFWRCNAGFGLYLYWTRRTWIYKKPSMLLKEQVIKEDYRRTGGGGGGGGGQTYSTAGAGTGTTTASTTGDDYYKFAEWDKWLMPGETDYATTDAGRI